MINRFLLIFPVLFFQFLVYQPQVLADHIDPSDPTQVNTSLKLGLEQTELNGDQISSFYATGKYQIENIQLTAEFGYGENEVTNKTSQRDYFIQVYHRFLNKPEKSHGLKNAGWYLDYVTPGSDYKDGLSSGYEVITPGIITAYAVKGSIIEYYPSISYHFARADDELLKNLLQTQGLDEEVQQLRLEIGISWKWDNPIYFTITPGVAIATKDSDDRFYFQLLAGMFVSENSAIELYAQYNFDDETDPQKLAGEYNFVRMNWEVFF